MTIEIEKTKKDILYWMSDYIANENNPPYSKNDVLECDVILTNFIKEINTSTEHENYNWVKAKVKTLVLTLNNFNDKFDGEIIETDQREGICDLIYQVMENAGHKVEEDITEEWREW